MDRDVKDGLASGVGGAEVARAGFPADMLEDIFERQARFDAELARLRGLDYDMATWVQKEVLALVAELGELLDEVNFKWWKNPRPIDRQAVKEELVDILHFFVSTCLKCGFSAREIYEAYLAKNEENFRRQRGLSEREGYAAAAGAGVPGGARPAPAGQAAEEAGQPAEAARLAAQAAGWNGEAAG